MYRIHHRIKILQLKKTKMSYKIIVIIWLSVLSCQKALTEQPIINVKYYGEYYYDSTIKFKDSILFRNDNKGQNWCYFYYFNQLFKVEKIPTSDTIKITNNNINFKGKK